MVWLYEELRRPLWPASRQLEPTGPPHCLHLRELEVRRRKIVATLSFGMKYSFFTYVQMGKKGGNSFSRKDRCWGSCVNLSRSYRVKRSLLVVNCVNFDVLLLFLS